MNVGSRVIFSDSGDLAAEGTGLMSARSAGRKTGRRQSRGWGHLVWCSSAPIHDQSFVSPSVYQSYRVVRRESNLRMQIT